MSSVKVGFKGQNQDKGRNVFSSTERKRFLFVWFVFFFQQMAWTRRGGKQRNEVHVEK
jgi:hypothetical protein